MDTNNDGKLQREELIQGYRQIYGDFAEEEVNKIMNTVDIDGSGEIDYSEWILATIDRSKLLSNDKLQKAFNYFDKDGSGSISVVEIRDILGLRKNIVNDQIWAQIVKEVDTDGNGEIDYNEFCTMMHQVLAH